MGYEFTKSDFDKGNRVFVRFGNEILEGYIVDIHTYYNEKGNEYTYTIIVNNGRRTLKNIPPTVINKA